ncbi:hypothetical protein [Streptomyces sp. NPDC059701]|uniref:hypothetical protein n=1 Tax=Streptomyces sp. NPDC059701 TaxID=3346914 RepID=UPI0036967E76
MGKAGPGRWSVGLGGVALALTVTSGCNPYGSYAGTGVHDATAREIAGTWTCVAGTQVTLRRDGTAVFRRLDGADFDFDEGWRLSGTGTWHLTDTGDGQEIDLDLTRRTGLDYRADALSGNDDNSPASPTHYGWDLYVDRGTDKGLRLFFFYGDPDTGNRYVLARPRT